MRAQINRHILLKDKETPLLENYLVKADIISSFVKLSSCEPISCKYRQSGLLQGWNKGSKIYINPFWDTLDGKEYKQRTRLGIHDWNDKEKDTSRHIKPNDNSYSKLNRSCLPIPYHISQPRMTIFCGSKTSPAAMNIKLFSCTSKAWSHFLIVTISHLKDLPSNIKPCTDWIQRTASSSFEYVIYLGKRRKQK